MTNVDVNKEPGQDNDQFHRCVNYIKGQIVVYTALIRMKYYYESYRDKLTYNDIKLGDVEYKYRAPNGDHWVPRQTNAIKLPSRERTVHQTPAWIIDQNLTDEDFSMRRLGKKVIWRNHITSLPPINKSFRLSSRTKDKMGILEKARTNTRGQKIVYGLCRAYISMRELIFKKRRKNNGRTAVSAF